MYIFKMGREKIYKNKVNQIKCYMFGQNVDGVWRCWGHKDLDSHAVTSHLVLFSSPALCPWKPFKIHRSTSLCAAAAVSGLKCSLDFPHHAWTSILFKGDIENLGKKKHWNERNKWSRSVSESQHKPVEETYIWVFRATWFHYRKSKR